MAELLLLQLSAVLWVTSSELPSDRKAVATNGWSNPIGIAAVAGVTCNAVTTSLVTVSSAVALKAVPLAVPEAVMVMLPGVIPVARPLALMAATDPLLLLQ